MQRKSKLEKIVARESRLAYNRFNSQTFSFVAFALLIMIIGFSLIQPTYTGFVSLDSNASQQTNESLNQTIKIAKSLINETSQGLAVVGEPVKWTKKIKLGEKAENLTISLPKEAVNVTAKKIENTTKTKVSKAKKKKGSLVLEESLSEVEVEYYTEAPKKTEKKMGGRNKKIVISSDTHYVNIKASTIIEDSRRSSVKLYWLDENNKKVLVEDAKYLDTNDNDLIDMIEWVVPHLSNQTYYVEINITDAEHLDSDKVFVSNIYEEVREIDDITYVVDEDEYVRAYFEHNLTSENVIDVYVYNSSGASIEVYEENSSVLVGKVSIEGDGAYYIDINHSGYQAVFDLKSINKSIVYDYVHDAKAGPNEFDADVTENVSTVNPGETINFTGSATSSRSYSYNICICKAGSTFTCTKQGAACGCSTGEWCSSTAVATSGQPNWCTYTTTTADIGDNSWIAYTCNDNGDESSLSNATNSPFSVNNAVPNTPSPIINSTDGSNQSNQDLNCFATITDDDNQALNVTVNWYVNGSLSMTDYYNNSYPNGTSFSASLGSGNTSAGDDWSCSMRIYDGFNYSSWGSSANITIIVTGNTAPIITWVETLSNQNPTEASTTLIEIQFNASDAENNFNHSSASLVINKSGVSKVGSCDNNTINSTATNYNCSVLLYYNDLSGVWSVNVSVSDDNSLNDYDDTTSFTYNTLYAFRLEKSTISFSSAAPGSTNLNSGDDPQILNNTGNGNFSFINITAYELSNGAGAFIGPGNFTVNVTDGKGTSLSSMISIPSAVLYINTTQDLYFWMDVPTPLSNGTYTTNTSTQWLVEAYN
ncbi:hypothetical protein GOV05_04680 [Candidatus Woesearchaeota archaeon]|nr:hypothetical protein [Candidatus Woesearchaeota archaeon]